MTMYTWPTLLIDLSTRNKCLLLLTGLVIVTFIASVSLFVCVDGVGMAVITIILYIW